MRRQRTIAFGFIGLIVLSSLLVLGFSILTLQRDGGSLTIILENTVLRMVAIYLLFILVVLILRYSITILLSYLEHINIVSRRDSSATEANDLSLPMISLVVPAYNEGVLIEAALKALLNLDYPNYEIIVVDDGSSDDTYYKALRLSETSADVPVRVLTQPNAGKAQALNKGISMAHGEFVLCMDGDSKLSSNTLRACVRHFADARVGAVAGNVKVINRNNIWSRIQALEYIEGLAMARKAQSFAHVVNIIPGPLGMFRKEVLREVGGYDHHTFAEDCDLTLKLLMHGWHIVYEPAAVAWVETPSSLLNLLKQRYRWTRGILQATTRHGWALWSPRRAGVNFWILWYMLFEGVVWPFSNVLSNLFFVYVSFEYGLITLLFFWWLQLTLLDLIAASYCVLIEKEDPKIIPYAILFRLLYINIIDVAKVLATIEEWRGTTMTWGKLEREGHL